MDSVSDANHPAGRSAAALATSARLSLGRVSRSVSTEDRLQFQLDHARARDAVHAVADFRNLAAALAQRGASPILLESAIPGGPNAREIYLRRPDLGRRLSPESDAILCRAAEPQDEPPQIAVILADGLSALAVDRHALPLVEALGPYLDGWRAAPYTLVRNGRVAIGDRIGEILQAQLTVLLIGERPGLTAPDSLGAYLTWNPRVGRTDAERNCVSNIRQGGLGYEDAAERIGSYARAARELGGTGFALKQGSSPKLPPVR